MIVGPPQDKAQDAKAVEAFIKGSDVHIACGGITSRIVSSYLKKELELEALYLPDGQMTYGHIGDVIATEGVITLTAVSSYLEGRGPLPYKGSGARRILEAFEDADRVRIIFGTSVNTDHEGILCFENKEKSLRIIKKELEKLGKKVEIIKF